MTPSPFGFLFCAGSHSCIKRLFSEFLMCCKSLAGAYNTGFVFDINRLFMG